MKIASFLNPSDVAIALPQGSKGEILDFLVRLIEKNHPELEHDMVLQILLKREDLRSTGIEQGVAFPHGRIPVLDSLLACFGRCDQGMDFDSFDGKPTYFFFVLLIPEHAQGAHLKALARLNRLFQVSSFRDRLMQADNSLELFEALMKEDERC